MKILRGHPRAEIRGFGVRSARTGRRIGRPACLEVITPVAVPDIELVPHEGEQHRVRAIQQLTVFDRLEVQFRQDVRRAPPIPTEAVPGFRREAGRVAHDWEYTTRALQ